MSKQVIIVRKDIKMSTQKFAIQVSHASIESFLQYGGWVDDDFFELKIPPGSVSEWLKGIYTKIILQVDSLEELLELQQKAKNLPHALITDIGKTEFKEPTITCLGIGPTDIKSINEITSHLKIYK